MNDASNRRPVGVYVGIAAVVALVTAGATALLVNIFERKQEAKSTFVKLVEVTENDVDPEKWGVNWPREYDGYKRTSEPTSTKYGGGQRSSEGAPPPEKSDRDPWLTRIFAGYLFAIDYRDRRGHAFMLQDQEATKRNVESEAKQSGNCLHCHASIMPLYKKLGKEALPQAPEAEQIQKGLALVSEMNYWDAHRLLAATTGGKAHPVSCVDCHDPKTMELRVTRPALHHRHPEARRLRRRRAAPAQRREVAPRRQEDRLRPQRRRHPPGDALLRLRPVPRRVLLRQGHDHLLPLGQGAQGRADGAALRRHAGEGAAASRTGSTPRPASTCSRPSTPSSRSGARASTPGAAWPAPTATCPTSARAP